MVRGRRVRERDEKDEKEQERGKEREREREIQRGIAGKLVPRAKANASYGTTKSSVLRLRLKRFMRRTVKEFAISCPYTKCARRRHKGGGSARRDIALR
jgi:hypothetical protein